MTSLLQGPLARMIGKAMAGVFYDAKLVRELPGEVDPNQPWVPVEPVRQEYPCKAFVDSYELELVTQGTVNASDAKLVVLQSSLATVPKVADAFVARGERFTVLTIQQDPAGATWELRGSR